MARSGTGRALYYSLGALQAFIGVGAVAGGWVLLTDPSGAGMGFRTAQLAGSPFPNYFIPGLILFGVNGVGSLIGAAMSFRRQRHAGVVAMALGVIMMAWLGIQVMVIGAVHWLQPFMFGAGLLEAILGFLVYRRKTAVAAKIRFN
jgi:disulfide bond formation protein DsbB